jgi:hypothetical protein
MKKILALILLTSQLAYGADFTITIQGSSTSKYVSKLKGDGVVVGDLLLAGFQSNFVLVNGLKWSISPSANFLSTNNKGDFLGIASFPCYYQSTNCSGECLISPYDGINTNFTNAVFSAASLGTGNYDQLILVSDTKTSGQVPINSCKEAYSGSCETADPGNDYNLSCGGAGTIIQNGQSKPNIQLRRATYHNRTGFALKPAHDFKFYSLEYE